MSDLVGSVEELDQRLRGTGYLPDEGLATVAYLALDVPLIRPQCYGGTRLGEVLKAFLDRWGQRGMARFGSYGPAARTKSRPMGPAAVAAAVSSEVPPSWGDSHA